MKKWEQIYLTFKTMNDRISKRKMRKKQNKTAY